MLLLVMVFVCGSASANVRYPLYIGITGGYGTTTWGMLATVNDPANPATFSVPIGAKEGGFAWGAMLGLMLSQYFALEFQYNHFPTAHITLLANSIYFLFDPNNKVINSSTHAYSLFGKFIIPIALVKNLSGYAGAGVEYIQRDDILAHKGNIGALFGVGLMYLMMQHLTAQVGFQLFTGYGKSSDEPVLFYIPFLYQLQFALAYHFTL